MDFIRSWAMTISLCSIGSALIYFLVPKGKFEKSMRTTISIFLLAAIISPLFKVQGLNLSDLRWDENIMSEKVSEQAENINKVAQEQFSKLVLDSLLKTLEVEGYKNIHIQVVATNNEKGQISVSEVLVISKIENEDEKDKIKEIIRQETGLEPIFK